MKGFVLAGVLMLGVVGAGAVEQRASAEVAPGMRTPGDHDQTITSDGVSRSYILHVPRGYDGRTRLPLVLVLHGHGGSARAMVASTGWNAQADEGGAVVAYLQATGSPSTWNTGLKPDAGITVNDVRYVRDVVAKVSSELAIDPSRVYAAGFSNGAMMAHKLGAELPDVLAAVAVVEGTIGIRQDDGHTYRTIPAPKAPMPVLIFHGKKDTAVPYDGGQGNGPSHIYVKSVADAVDFWTRADGCEPTPQTTRRPTGDVATDYRACAERSEVLLFTLPEGVHQWPTPDDAGKMSATHAQWEFFGRHRKERALPIR